jgi:hypothetical protein
VAVVIIIVSGNRFEFIRFVYVGFVLVWGISVSFVINSFDVLLFHGGYFF